jgi:hypothetical protein
MQNCKILSILILMFSISCATPFINNGPQETFSISRNWDLNIISNKDSLFTVCQLSKSEIAIYSDFNYVNKDTEMDVLKLNKSFIFGVKIYKEIIGVLKSIIDRYDNTEVNLPAKAVIYFVTETYSSVIATTYRGGAEIENRYKYLFRIQYIENTSSWRGEPDTKNKSITCYLKDAEPMNINIKHIRFLYNDLLKCNLN